MVVLTMIMMTRMMMMETVVMMVMMLMIVEWKGHTTTPNILYAGHVYVPSHSINQNILHPPIDTSPKLLNLKGSGGLNQ